MIALDTKITIEVFSTNVSSPAEASRVTDTLRRQFPYCKITFDLQDCDKILRVEGGDLILSKIEAIVKSLGFNCQPLG